MEEQRIWMVFLFTAGPITWEDGFDTGDGIPMVRSDSIEGIKGDGRGASCQGGGGWEGRALKNQYLHYTYRDISDQIQTIDKYSQIAAEDLAPGAERNSASSNFSFILPFDSSKSIFSNQDFVMDCRA